MAHAARVLAAVARNRELRRLGLAFAGFNAAEWAVWIAMLVYAYGRGGATTAGVVAIVQLVPAALFAPFAATLADRHRPAAVLAAGYLAQAAAMGATATALLAGAPPLAAYALAAVAASAVTVTRPTQAALLPALARTPDELTAANVASGWIESASVLAGPALAGLLLGLGDAGLVFAAMAALALASALFVGPIAGAPPAGGERGGAFLGGQPDEAPAGAVAEVAAGFRALGRHPESRLLVGLLGAQFILIGALDVLFVVLALGVLDLGDSGAGYLNAAFGAGGVVGIAATSALVGRRLFVPPLLFGIGVWSLAFAAIGLAPSTAGAFLLLAAAGLGRSLFDVAGRSLLQRAAPADVLGRVFGVLEGLSMAGLALGSLLAPALVAVGGAEAAFLGAAALLPTLALVAGARLARIDRSADVPIVQLALLRSAPVTAALGGPELERLARALAPVSVPAGELVFRQGDPGDRFYFVASGELEVIEDGRRVNELSRGDAFGEIALLEDRPRTASVGARHEAALYALDREEFLAAVAGQSGFEREARRLAEDRLARSAALATAAPEVEVAP